MNAGKNPRLKMLQPRASKPPSAKKNACTVNTEAMTRNAAYGPRRIVRISPPPRCPLDPVPGIEKLIICAAKMKAPSTPIMGTRSSRRVCFTLLAHKAISPPDTAHNAPPTAGETKASAMCMLGLPLFFRLSGPP
jgi:hypothetical protein